MREINITELAADVVKAFVAHNSIPATELRNLVETVHASFAKLVDPGAGTPSSGPTASAATIRDSITADHIVSLENGKKYRTLRFHLAKLGLTPDTYRQKWRLPTDYPMVAASFAARRSALAKESGFGKTRSGRGAKASK